MLVIPTRRPASGVCLLLSLAALLSTGATAATITVTSTADTLPDGGQCTLREAIVAANTNTAAGGCSAGEAAPTVDLISFNIAGPGVQTISPLSPMPPIGQVVTIDGYSQPGAHANTLAVGNDAVLLIEINGTSVGGDLFAIVGGGGSTVRGLVINHLAGTAITISSSSSNTIAGNFFGTDSSGAVFLGTIGVPIRIGGTANVIGGTTAAARNVIVGGSSSFAGTILINGPNGGNFIQGNYIGVNAAGTAAMQPPAATDAIEVLNSPGNTIGGATTGAGNVILGTQFGIRLGAGSAPGNTVQANFIGTDATGSVGLGGGTAISTDNGASFITIGGATAGAGNVISGNARGILLGDGAASITIKGNKIGTNASGTSAVPNSGNGIEIAVQGAGSIIGGINAGEGNTIAFNCGLGISVSNFFTLTNWAMLGNSIHDNGGLGIALNAGTHTINDPGDGDTGANNLQNYPVITAAPIGAGVAAISGTFNSIANKTFRLEFFASDRCDASGFGEGKQFIGSIPAALTNGSGDFSFNAVPFPVPGPGVVFTATATDEVGNTSEFSECFGTPDLVYRDGFEPSCPGA